MELAAYAGTGHAGEALKSAKSDPLLPYQQPARIRHVAPTHADRMKSYPGISVVRHGESQNNVLGIECTKIENKDLFGLSEHGRVWVAEMASLHQDFDVIFSSPLRRAIETASAFANTSKGADLVIDPLLIEIDMGVFELRPETEGDAWLVDQGEDFTFPNGEGPEDARNRARHFLRKLQGSHLGAEVLLVTHGSFLKFLFQVVFPGFTDRQWDVYLEQSKFGRRVMNLDDVLVDQ